MKYLKIIVLVSSLWISLQASTMAATKVMKQRVSSAIVGNELVTACYDFVKNIRAIQQVKKEYGIEAAGYTVAKELIQTEVGLSDILNSFDLPHQTVHKAIAQTEHLFDTDQLIDNQSYVTLTNSSNDLHYLIYETSPTSYVTLDFTSDKVHVDIKEQEKKVVTKTYVATGIIYTSLYRTISNKNLNPKLANHLEEIFDWSVDFFKIQKGDRFKILYDQETVNGRPLGGIKRIKAAYFRHKGKEHYAFAFKNGKKTEFYDENGRSMQKGFLKAPLKYSRISSGFSKRRYHPVLKRYKSHLGIDYAAPRGTPIRAVGDGLLEEVGYTRGNGRYVKIKHNKTYSTQYLHMSKFARGIKRGRSVRQGNIIGYVGSTGYATGPHLCYRFWKNGKQVDPYKERGAFTSKMPKKLRKKFQFRKNKLKKILDKLVY